MRFILRTDGHDVDQALRDSLKRGLHFALSRFGDRVRRVAVTFARARRDSVDGFDTRCRLLVQLAPSGRVRVEVADTDLESAWRRALHRVGPAVDREIASAREIGRNLP